MSRREANPCTEHVHDDKKEGYQRARTRHRVAYVAGNRIKNANTLKNATGSMPILAVAFA